MLVTVVLAIAGSYAQTAEQILRENAIKRKKTVSLFDGKSLNGWYTFLHDQGRDRDPDGVFSVNEGIIHITGSEYGCITTEKEYENYDLVVEFKWGSQTHEPRVNAARDNGVLIHSQGKDGGYAGNWMHSIECQIIEGGTGDFLVVGDGSDDFSLTSPVESSAKPPYYYHPDGQPVTIHKGRINWFGRDPAWKDVKGFRGTNDIEKPVGEWNRVRILAVGDDIYYFLNGKLVNRAMHVKPAKGRIQIQSEGAEMFVRKVELTSLVRR